MPSPDDFEDWCFENECVDISTPISPHSVSEINLPLTQMKNLPLTQMKIDIDEDAISLRDLISNSLSASKVQPKYKKYKPHKIGSCVKCKLDILDDLVKGYFKYGRIDRNTGERNYFICAQCIKEFVTCSSCNYYYLPKEIVYGHCPDCVKQAPEKLIKPYSYKIEREFKSRGQPMDQMFFGVELEYESSDYGLDTLKVHNLIKEFATLKKDSSINQGFEIVSVPCSMDVHETLWNNFFEQLPSTIFPEATCGMHVHVSRVRLGDLQIGKMLCFIHNAANRTFITAIAGRSSGFQNNFEKKKALKDGREGGKLQKDMDRHTALNLNNNKTIEFRIFQSTLNRDIFLKNIEFCRALVKFTGWGEHSIKDAQFFTTFYKFVEKFKKDYPFLWKFLQTAKVFEPLRVKSVCIKK